MVTRIATTTLGLLVLLGSLATPCEAASKQRRQIGVPLYTIQTEHFRINYEEGLEQLSRKVGGLLEEMYARYRDDYHLVLPRRTDVLVTSTEDNENSFASANTNLIAIAANDFGIDWFLRGSGNYLRDVVAHEFAHIISISSGMKAPEWLLGMQVGYFSNPNTFNFDDNGKPTAGTSIEAMHIFPFENLPIWFIEGLAQFESTRMGGDRWDSHRDMILRTLTLSGRLLSYDHMHVFAGRSDDFEKSYNHGFSMVSYIDQTYGHEALVSLLNQNSRLLRINFDRSIRRVLGITGRKLYDDWQQWLEKRYKAQVAALGTQVYGRKISPYGFDNRWPRFTPNDSSVMFQSSWKRDYSWNKLEFFRHDIYDTSDTNKRTKPMGGTLQSYYDINDSLNLMVYSMAGSLKSRVPFNKGGERVRDLYLDTIHYNRTDKHERTPKSVRRFYRNHEDPFTRKQSLFAPALSPAGNRVAAGKHVFDRFYLCIVDTAQGATPRIVFPDKRDTAQSIQTIYSTDWSPDGHSIVFSYVRQWGDRRIGIYDTLDRSFREIAASPHDDRDPVFSSDGRWVYFASDRTGVFNIYRHSLDSGHTERLTNVSGGAFMPDIATDSRRLTYVNYDTAGYSIYLLDSVRAIDTMVVTDSVLAEAAPATSPASRAVISAPEPYSRLPRQFMLVPTIYGEQTTTSADSIHKGVGVTKAGAVFYLMDPFGWIRGNEIGGYLLLEPSKLFQFLDRTYVINPDVNYDMGLFGSTSYLPVRLDIEYFQRGIAGQDIINSSSGDSLERTPIRYSIVPHVFSLWASKSLSDFSNVPLKLSLVGSYNAIDVHMFWTWQGEGTEDDVTYTYAKGYRLGAFVSTVKRNADRYFWIAPRGLALKLAYDFYEQELQNSNESIDQEGFAVNSDFYRYHQISGSLSAGWKMPWSRKHRLYTNVFATGVELTDRTSQGLRERGLAPSLTSFYEPVIQLPGYAFYYRDTLRSQSGIDRDSVVDTVLVSGNALAAVNLSYRFPLWPRSIDKKLGFIYFDKVFGAINASAGAGWYRVRDVLEMRRDDWLTSIGAELRIEAVSFNRYPFMVSFKWDRGLDRAAPVGGDRFSLGIGFAFEDWGMLDRPDWFAAPVSNRTGYGALGR